jgi:hypothetical protein
MGLYHKANIYEISKKNLWVQTQTTPPQNHIYLFICLRFIKKKKPTYRSRLAERGSEDVGK